MNYLWCSLSNNLTNKPVDSVIRFSSDFISYNHSFEKSYSLTFLFTSFYLPFKSLLGNISIISIYTIFELGGYFFSLSGLAKKADSLDLFSNVEKLKVIRLDDFLNFVHTFFYFIVRDYEEYGVYPVPLWPMCRDESEEMRFRTIRCVFWRPPKSEEEFSKLPRFFVNYKYFVGSLSFLDDFSFFSCKYTKCFQKPLFDNFFFN